MAQTSTATSMSTATLLSCSPGYPVCLSTSWSFTSVGASLNTEPALRNFYSSSFNVIVTRFVSGKTDITWMMLDAGAETDVVNSVGRTAAQMAAFVGEHTKPFIPLTLHLFYFYLRLLFSIHTMEKLVLKQQVISAYKTLFLCVYCNDWWNRNPIFLAYDYWLMIMTHDFCHAV